MGNQQSQKRGLRSESQKEERARDAYAPIPPSNPVRGAFGAPKNNPLTDEAPYTSPTEAPKAGKRTEQKNRHQEAKK